MALNFKIKPEIEKDMKRLLSRAGVRTKTEYVNMALQEYNRKLSRELDLEKTSVIPAKAGIHHSFPR